ncbi:AI-2E family transporter [Salinispirillum sp. LH 10-3-1]|uniref:AI-2E family transporter n=1 Tax=Salinispirillum sp. LH 10-3-1 TaxID=2952525 RepID=A0AB38YDX0_9GAMM
MNTHTETESQGLRWLLGLAAVVIIIAGLKVAEAIVIPMMLALFLGIISLPPLHLMTRKGVPPIIAIAVVFATIMLFGGILAIIISASIDSFMNRLPEYQARLEMMTGDLFTQLELFGFPVDVAAAMDQFNPSQAMNLVGRAMSSVGSVLTNVFLVVFILLFLLLEQATFSAKFKRAMPPTNQSVVHATSFIRQVNKYLAFKSLISLVTGIIITLFLWIVGVDFPLLWGLVALLMNFIPNVGSILAAIPAVLLATVQLGVGDAVIVALGYLAVNVVMGNLIEPRVMGSGLGLSPLVVFLSLILWGWLFGPVGMFLSIPLTMIVKIALEQSSSTRWIAIMLGNMPITEDSDEDAEKPVPDSTP